MERSLFVLGDSISIDYTPHLRVYLGDSWQVTRKGDLPAAAIPGEPEPDNGGDSQVVLAYLTAMLPQIAAQIILLNCGLHDIKRYPSRDSAPQVARDDYRTNLQEMLQLIRSYHKHVLWVTTTPVDDHQHTDWEKKFFRFDADVRNYNDIADKTMKDANVPVLKLGDFTRNLVAPLYRDHVHYTEPISQLQAAFLCGSIMNFYNLQDETQ